MNRLDAYNILEINPTDPNMRETIKQQYRLYALKYHPDKNRDENAVDKFIKVNEAYEYLMKYHKQSSATNSDNWFNIDDDIFTKIDECMHTQDNSYSNILLSFIKSIVRGESRETLYYTILQKVSTMCESSAIDMLEKLDKQILLKIYEILNRYPDAFHFKQTFLDRIKTIIYRKNESSECIILNPTLDDLYNNNLYRLAYKDESYVVPLWHHELIYDYMGTDVYIKCYPMLPDNITIDNKNNVHVSVNYKIQDLLNMDTIMVQCHNKQLPITVNTLRITDKQTIVFAKQGITRINTDDIYDISRTSDVKITILLQK